MSSSRLMREKLVEWQKEQTMYRLDPLLAALIGEIENGLGEVSQSIAGLAGILQDMSRRMDTIEREIGESVEGGSPGEGPPEVQEESSEDVDAGTEEKVEE